MFPLPVLIVAVLTGVAVSAPGQLAVEVRLAPRVQARLAVGPVCPPVVVPRGGPVEPVIRGRGRWEDRCERVWVPGHWREETVPPSYGWVRDACGGRHWAIVQPGFCQRIWVPGRWELQTRSVWVRC